MTRTCALFGALVLLAGCATSAKPATDAASGLDELGRLLVEVRKQTDAPTQRRVTAYQRIEKLLLAKLGGKQRHRAVLAVRDNLASPKLVRAVAAELRTMLKVRVTRWRDAATRCVACEVLGKYPDWRSVPALLTALEDPFETHFFVPGPEHHVGHEYQAIWMDADSALRRITGVSPIPRLGQGLSGPRRGDREKTLAAWKQWWTMPPGEGLLSPQKLLPRIEADSEDRLVVARYHEHAVASVEQEPSAAAEAGLKALGVPTRFRRVWAVARQPWQYRLTLGQDAMFLPARQKAGPDWHLLDAATGKPLATVLDVRSAPPAPVPDKVDVLQDQLKDGDMRQREQAARALGEMGPAAAKAVPALAKRTQDEGCCVRAEAAQALGRIGVASKPVLDALVRLLDDDYWQSRHAAAKALGTLGPAAGDATEALKNALKHTDRVVRSLSAEALGKVAPVKDSVPVLTKAAGDEHRTVRLKAAVALGTIGPDAASAVGALMATLREEGRGVEGRTAGEYCHQVRTAIAKALAQIGSASVEPLAEALRISDNQLQRYAAIALGQMGEAVLKQLAEAMNDEDAGTRRWAVDALGRIGPKAVGQLSVAMTDEDLWVRRWAADALGNIGPAAKAGVPALIEALSDKQSEVRHWTADALGDIGPPAASAVDALTQALADETADVRNAAAEALGQIGPASAKAVPALTGLLTDKDWYVRVAVVGALGRIGPAASAAEAALRLRLEDEDKSVRSAAAFALKKIRPAPVIVDLPDGRRVRLTPKADTKEGRLMFETHRRAYPAAIRTAIARDANVRIEDVVVAVMARERVADGEPVPAEATIGDCATIEVFKQP